MESKICSVWFILVLRLVFDILREVPFGIPRNWQACGFLKYTSYGRKILSLMMQTFQQFGWPKVCTTQRLRSFWLALAYGLQSSLRFRNIQ